MRIGSTLKTAGFVINCSILAVLFALWTASEISPIEYVNMANYPSGYIEFTSAGGKLSVLSQYGGIACLPYSTLINPLLIWPGIVFWRRVMRSKKPVDYALKPGPEPIVAGIIVGIVSPILIVIAGGVMMALLTLALPHVDWDALLGSHVADVYSTVSCFIGIGLGVREHHLRRYKINKSPDHSAANP